MDMVNKGKENVNIDAEGLYRKLGRLIEVFPDLGIHPTPHSVHSWLGQACALVEMTGILGDNIFLATAINRLNTAGWQSASHEITAIVFRAFAKAELNAPPSLAGVFIPVGNSFDAFSIIAKLLKSAKNEVFIIDPYLDEVILTEFLVSAPSEIKLRLMADKRNLKPSLKLASIKWIQQYGDQKPLVVRVAPVNALHDRMMIIDSAITWSLTQSFNGIAKRSPAEFIRTDDTASLKITAYEEIWEQSKQLCSADKLNV